MTNLPIITFLDSLKDYLNQGKDFPPFDEKQMEYAGQIGAYFATINLGEEYDKHLDQVLQCIQRDRFFNAFTKESFEARAEELRVFKPQWESLQEQWSEICKDISLTSETVNALTQWVNRYFPPLIREGDTTNKGFLHLSQLIYDLYQSNTKETK